MYDLTGFDVISNIPGVLVGWVGGKGAIEMESICEVDLAQQCTQLLKNFIGRSDIPLPLQVVR